MKIHIAQKLLGVQNNATHKEIKHAWKLKMKKYHPDKCPHSVIRLRYLPPPLTSPPCKSLNEAKFTLLNDHENHGLFNTLCANGTKQNYFYPFNNISEEFEFWEHIMRGFDDDLFLMCRQIYSLKTII